MYGSSYGSSVPNHRDSPDSPGLTGTHRWPFRLGLKGHRAGRRRSPQRGAARRSLRSGHGSASWKSGSRGKGKFAEFIRETAELARSVSVFARGPVSIHGTTGSSTPAFMGTQAWDGAAFWDPPVGQGDPGVKPGAFLPGLPVFLRSRREDHGLNGYLWVLVWVPGSELPGLTGGRIALGSRANGQGGDGAPPRGRRPTVVYGRTWFSGTGVKKQAGWGSARSSSTNVGKLAPEHRDQVPGCGESGTE